MAWRIFATLEFEKDFKKLDNAIQSQVRKEIEQLKENPFVGKPLGYEFFREKKALGYRIYYLIYEESVVVFLAAISNKKQQQKAIKTIKALIPFYREEIKRKIKQGFISKP